ncbi:ABC transporter, partial [Enterococcus faecium]
MFLLILTVLLKKRNVLAQKSLATNQYLYSFIIYLTYKIIICQIKRDKTFHLRNSKKLLMVFG